MLHLDSYQTTVGSIFKTKELISSIKEVELIDDYLDKSLGIKTIDNIKPVFITGASDFESKIKLFTHPISIFNSDGSGYLCTDLRLYIRKNPDLKHIENSIKNITEFNFAKTRAILNLLWLTSDRDNIKISMSFASIVYSFWLSDVISKAFALDYNDKLTISVAASYFYQSLFIDGDITDDIRERMVVHTIKTTGVSADKVFSILDSMRDVETIDDFAIELPNIVENIRLKGFNLTGLLTIVKNSWYGLNAKEVLAVALEFPPTWIALVFTALQEKTFRNSVIAKLSEQLGARNRADEFIKNYTTMSLQTKNVSTEEIVIRELED